MAGKFLSVRGSWRKSVLEPSVEASMRADSEKVACIYHNI